VTVRFLVTTTYPDGRVQENEWGMDQLAAPNGGDQFLVWFLKEATGNGSAVRLETIREAEGLPGYFEVLS
jgi:hypothetical protein